MNSSARLDGTRMRIFLALGTVLIAISVPGDKSVSHRAALLGAQEGGVLLPAPRHAQPVRAGGANQRGLPHLEPRAPARGLPGGGPRGQAARESALHRSRVPVSGGRRLRHRGRHQLSRRGVPVVRTAAIQRDTKETRIQGSLKIEGRMKSAEYVANVVSAYRMALDAPADRCKHYRDDQG